MTSDCLTVEEIAGELQDRLFSYDGSQNDFAKEIGVAPSYISMLLNGRPTIGPKLLKALGYQTTPLYRRCPQATEGERQDG